MQGHWWNVQQGKTEVLMFTVTMEKTEQSLTLFDQFNHVLLIGLVLLFVWGVTSSLWSAVSYSGTISGCSAAEKSRDEEPAICIFQWALGLKKWWSIYTIRMKLRISKNGDNMNGWFARIKTWPDSESRKADVKGYPS